MSLTSYRAAPPRVMCFRLFAWAILKREQRPLGPLVEIVIVKILNVFCRPGGDLLSRVLRQSTIGAEAFDGRVRDGIGSGHFAESHQAGERHFWNPLFFKGPKQEMVDLIIIVPLSHNPSDCAVAARNPEGCAVDVDNERQSSLMSY